MNRPTDYVKSKQRVGVVADTMLDLVGNETKHVDDRLLGQGGGDVDKEDGGTQDDNESGNASPQGWI
ncbi:hypothetical protein GC175_15145 [bacterium]|nr:hypothetical protein [bacterium]